MPTFRPTKQRTGRLMLLAACSALMLSTQSVASEYKETWNDRNLGKSSLLLHGGCYKKPKAPYNSFEFSSKHKSEGKYSLRVELNGQHKNERCSQSWARNEKKSRSEIRLANNHPQFKNIQQGQEIWFSTDLYVPSNEGSFRSWWKSGRRVIVTQLMGAGNSSTPEIALLLGGGKLEIEHRHSTVSKGEKITLGKKAVSISENRWNRIVINWKRSADKNGKLKVWINDKLVLSHSGPSSIKNKPFAYAKLGAYFGTEKRNERYVLYFDNTIISSKAPSGKKEGGSGNNTPLPLPPSNFRASNH